MQWKYLGRTEGQTEGRMDRQTEVKQYTPPPSGSGGIKIDLWRTNISQSVMSEKQKHHLNNPSLLSSPLPVRYKGVELHRCFHPLKEHCFVLMKHWISQYMYIVQNKVVMVFNTTFNNISVPGENHRSAATHWQTWLHNVASSTLCHERGSYSQC